MNIEIRGMLPEEDNMTTNKKSILVVITTEMKVSIHSIRGILGQPETKIRNTGSNNSLGEQLKIRKLLSE